MAEVYWIRLPEHTDVFTEGYVGVTKYTAKKRYSGHLNSLTKKEQPRSILQNAIMKYKDRLLVETLVICDMEYAFFLEEKLRPNPKTGWNIRMGGKSPEAFSATFKDQKFSKEECKRRSEAFKRLWKEERYTRLRVACESRTAAPRPLDKEGSPSRFWLSSHIGPMNHMWEMAQKCRDIYDSYKYCSTKEITEAFLMDEGSRTWFQPMLRYFDGGWIPKEDPLWCSDFNYGSPDRHKIICVDWLNYKEIWASADKVYELFSQGVKLNQAERDLGLTRGKLCRMYEYFQDGWNPSKDSIWINTFKKGDS